MAKSKLNSLPEYKAPPPPPAPKIEQIQKPIGDVVDEVLNLLKPYTPEQQNSIIAETLKETTYIRHQEMLLQRDKLTQAEGNFKEFISLQHIGERVIQEMENPKKM